MSSTFLRTGLSLTLACGITVATSQLAYAATPASDAFASVEMKLLVISATGNDPELDTTRNSLETLGTPYSVMIVKDDPLEAADLVYPDGTGKYSGIILTSGNLSHEVSPGKWDSAFDATEWQTLWNYEKNYGIRQVALNSYPSNWPENYGFDYDNVYSVTDQSYDVHLTDEGAATFPYLQKDAVVAIKHAYVYVAKLSENSTAKPLLVDKDGYLVALRSDTPDGRERIVFTYSQNQHMLHTHAVFYGLIKWVSHDVFIGARKVYLQVDIDDWFQFSDLWDPNTNSIRENSFRIDSSDVRTTYALQRRLNRKYPLAHNFKIAVAFNGHNAEPKSRKRCYLFAHVKDPLTSITRCMRKKFDWINHTYTEQDMDFTDYKTSHAEIKDNFDLGKKLRLKMSKKMLLTGTHSGLGYYPELQPDGSMQFVDHGLEGSNKALLAAMKDLGVKYMASNISVPSQKPPCSSCGMKHPLEPSLFLIPRYPTNVFYFSSTPEEETSYYNSLYGPQGSQPFFAYNSDYSDILEFETDIALLHMLRFEPFPHFFHQANLRAYAPNRNLVFDWVNRLVEKYSALYSLPIVNNNWDKLGVLVETQSEFNQASKKGIWNRATQTITLSSESGGPMILTGARFGKTVRYGGELISQKRLKKDKPLTIRLR